MVPQRRRRRRAAPQPVGGNAWRLIVSRGPQGFGFTIAGQAPCVVSHVATGGPADRAGLRVGLVLVAVGATGIARAPHDVVARLIAAAPQAIALTVATDRDRERSDTSDDERARPRPRHPQRSRTRPPRADSRPPRFEPPFRRRFPDSNGIDPHAPSLVSAALKCNTHLAQNSMNECCSASQYQGCSPSTSVAATDTFNNIRRLQQLPLTRNELQLQCCAVVGYLGTIETPTPITSGSELHTVRTSIRKLRQEKRSSTIVLMTVLPSSMNLKKINGTVLAEYTRKRISYISCSSENDHRYFGLITCTLHVDSNSNVFPESANLEVETCHSCHVFTVDPKLVEHNAHLQKANEFQIKCTLDPVTNHCLEFPASAEYIVGVIRSMYSLQMQNGILSPNLENISKLAIKSSSPVFGINFSRNNNHPALRAMRNGRRVNAAAYDHRADFPPNPIDNFRQEGQDFVSNSPQPSNHSEMTTTSSNSDSGIGFHHDCQNIADRILVVDFGQQIQQVGNGLNNPYDNQSCVGKGDVKQRPLGIVGCSYDMDSSFLSNTMPVVDGFGGRGQPLNHLDDVILRGCDVQQPHCSFTNNITNVCYPTSPQGDLSKVNGKDTYNYNNLHYGNVPSCSKEVFQNCFEDATNQRPHYDNVYTDTEGHHYEMINPQVQSLDLDKMNEKFNGIKVYCDDIVYPERPIPDSSQKSSNETESVDNMTVISSKSQEYLQSGKTSMDDISMYSSRSQEYFSPKTSHMKKMQASVDNILMLGLGKTENEESRANTEDHNFLHPGNLKIKIRKSMKPLNLLSKTMIMFHGKDDKKNAKTPERGERARALSASVDNVCGGQGTVGSEFPTASSEPDLRDNSSQNSESDQSSPFRRWTTGGPGSSYRHHDPRTMYNKQMSEGSPLGVKEGGGGAGGGVARWSLGLEHLLADPAGSAAFAAFLAKEFAAENIKFWWSCERYRTLNASERTSAGREIWTRHLAEGAPEPVNVDAPARRAAALSLDDAPPDLFNQAQKQIFNLMKFDSYPRFLRSGVHAECARADLRGDHQPYLPDLPAAAPPTPTKLKKSASNVSERRRSGGSLLPWSRLRAASRDRDLEKQPPPTNDVVQTGVSGSCSLCRVVLPDGATSVVGVDPCLTVRRLVDRLLARRALHDTCRAYDVLLVAGTAEGQPTLVELESPSTALGGRSARVERRCVFRLELPERRAVAVRCRPGKRLRHVLKPVLARYLPDEGHRQPILIKDQQMIPLDTKVQDIDGGRLQVLFEDGPSTDYLESGGRVEEEELDDLRLQEDIDTQCGSVYSNEGQTRVVRAALRPGPPVHPQPHPPDFLENLRQTQRARLQTKPESNPVPLPRSAPPPLPPKPRPAHAHDNTIPTHNTAAAGALV